MTMALLCITTSRYQYQQLHVTAVAAVIMLEIMKDVRTGVKVQCKLSECESEFFILFSRFFFRDCVFLKYFCTLYLIFYGLFWLGKIS